MKKPVCMIFLLFALPLTAFAKGPLRIGYLPALSQLPLIVSHEKFSRQNPGDYELVKYRSFTSLEAAIRVGAIHIASIPVPTALSVAADGRD